MSPDVWDGAGEIVPFPNQSMGDCSIGSMRLGFCNSSQFFHF